MLLGLSMYKNIDEKFKMKHIKISTRHIISLVPSLISEEPDPAPFERPDDRADIAEIPRDWYNLRNTNENKQFKS